MGQPRDERDVVVVNYVWPGVKVAALAGGTIGICAVVASGTLVTMDLSQQCNSFVVPAKGIAMHLRPGAVT